LLLIADGERRAFMLTQVLKPRRNAKILQKAARPCSILEQTHAYAAVPPARLPG
jgi:hypothetical protein